MGLTEERIQQAWDLVRYGSEFSSAERAAIEYAHAVVRHGADAATMQPLYDEMKLHFDDGQVLELAVFCALCIGFDKVIATLEVPVEFCEIPPSKRSG
jgi:alkylhydroperoxidase family enzyme